VYNSPNTSYHLTDGLGSVRGMVNAMSDVLSTTTYSPYGVPDSPIAGFAFTGEQRDTNGLQYHRARYYNAGLGTWASLDPFEGIHNRPMSLNGYAWVEGNVVNMVDPSGLNSCDCIEEQYYTGQATLEQLEECLAGTQNVSTLEAIQITPTLTSTPCAGGQLDECDIRYLAHISAAESSGTGSNEVMAAIMLSQINRFKQTNGKFYGFRVTETFIEQQFGINIPDEQQTTLGYSEYVSRCRSNTDNFPVPNFLGYSIALQMARAMSCTSNPLIGFNNSNFEITNITKLQTVSQSPNLTQENSFCSSVISKVQEWQTSATDKSVCTGLVSQ
jgi:RHS repeat-associated protein